MFKNSQPSSSTDDSTKPFYKSTFTAAFIKIDLASCNLLHIICIVFIFVQVYYFCVLHSKLSKYRVERKIKIEEVDRMEKDFKQYLNDYCMAQETPIETLQETDCTVQASNADAEQT